MNNIKSIIKDWIPPALIRLATKNSKKYGWSGDYATWEEAEAHCSGYDSEIILKKVKNALLKVKNGEAVYERDSVLFDEIQYSWPLLSGLMWVAAQNNGELNVLDFGGSLGSTYFQNLKFLQTLKKVSWNIVEQESFVDCGSAYLKNSNLQFYDDLDECFNLQKPDTVILSSVLQYIEKPFELLTIIMSYNFKYIIFDRTPFIKKNKDLLTVQIVPPEIYSGSYPCWFFDRKNFIDFCEKKYSIMASFDALDNANIDSCFQGFLCRKKSID